MSKFDIYETVTNQIIERLKAGVVPWQMPWKISGVIPRNLVSNKPYRGFNFWCLISFGFERAYFLTFKQVQDLGANVLVRINQEELVAEMGSAYLCGICGIENATIDNSAAYIQGWLKKLKNDYKFIVSASGMAQHAVDYILEHQDSNPKPVLKEKNIESENASIHF